MISRLFASRGNRPIVFARSALLAGTLIFLALDQLVAQMDAPSDTSCLSLARGVFR